ncbi:hypothetical protein Efla_001486 [Eimeria flavescens]
MQVLLQQQQQHQSEQEEAGVQLGFGVRSIEALLPLLPSALPLPPCRLLRLSVALLAAAFHCSASPAKGFRALGG